MLMKRIKRSKNERNQKPGCSSWERRRAIEGNSREPRGMGRRNEELLEKVRKLNKKIQSERHRNNLMLWNYK